MRRKKELAMWSRTAAVLIVCYLSLGRAFAYLGVPVWNIFVSEVALALFLICGPKTDEGRWLKVAPRSPALRPLSIVYALFLAYGALQIAHGILAGNEPL